MWRSNEEAELKHLPQMLHEWSVAPASTLCYNKNAKIREDGVSRRAAWPFQSVSPYLSDVHGQLMLRLAALVAKRAHVGGVIVFAVLAAEKKPHVNGAPRAEGQEGRRAHLAASDAAAGRRPRGRRGPGRFVGGGAKRSANQSAAPVKNFHFRSYPR